MLDIEASMMSNDPAQKPTRDCFLNFCRMVNIITGICASLCLMAHLMAVAQRTEAVSIFSEADRIYRQVIRIFSVAFAVIIILAEVEFEWFMSMMRIMEYWIFRGFLHIFLAVLTLELATADGNSDFSKSVRLYRTVSGIAMLVCGIFYLLGGCCCFGTLKKARHRRMLDRRRVHEDLAKIEKQREDLRNRLIAEDL